MSKSFRDLNKDEQKNVKQTILEVNTKVASLGLLGFAVKKLSPSKDNRKKFQEQFDTHSLCGCYGCMQMAKIFIDKAPDMKEEIVIESMKDLETFRVR